VGRAGRGQSYAAGDPDLAAVWVAPHLAAKGRGHDLQAPAAAEDRRAGLEEKFEQHNLGRDLGVRLVDVQARAGPNHPVDGGRVDATHDRHRIPLARVHGHAVGARREGLQHGAIDLGIGARTGRPHRRRPRRGIALDDQETEVR
jgi:hypothetical protein